MSGEVRDPKCGDFFAGAEGGAGVLGEAGKRFEDGEEQDSKVGDGVLDLGGFGSPTLGKGC